MSAVVERTHPFMGPLPDPPERPSDEEIRAIMAPVAVIAADDVSDALDELARHWTGFLIVANSLSDLEARGAHAEPRRELDEHRQGFRTQLERVQRLIRADLRR
jgi:hypothetical protein